MKVTEKQNNNSDTCDNFARELCLLFFLPPCEPRMHIKFLVLTSAVFAFAMEIPWASNHRFYEPDDRQLPSNDKRDTRNNDHVRRQRIEGDKSAIDRGSKISKEGNADPWNLSENTDRIQFQVEGHEGPQTYIFGFDTGHGKNRQYRLEERHRDGTVKGQYGYYDANGELKKVRYVAKPFHGYTEIHHQSNVHKIED